MEKKLEFISAGFFMVLLITLFLVLGVETPIPFDGVGKSLFALIIVSGLGTIVPLLISKSKE
jgi:hypothetical protein